MNTAAPSASLDCPACGAPMHPVSSWANRCSRCGYMNSSLAAGSSPLGAGFEELRRGNFEELLDRLGGHMTLAGARLLEVGCGPGWFLEAASRRGMTCRAIEPDTDAEIARSKGFDVTVGFFPDDLQGAGPFDAIVFNDVFEHIPDPVKAIRAVQDFLVPGGMAVVNLPSAKGTFFRIAGALDRLGWSGPYDRMWQKGLASPHMSYFDPENLTRLVERHTDLRRVDTMALSSVKRQGLRERIKITTPGALGDVVFAGVWLGSFALPLLPPDIAAVLFRRPPDAAAS